MCTFWCVVIVNRYYIGSRERNYREMCKSGVGIIEGRKGYIDVDTCFKVSESLNLWSNI